MNEEGNKPNWKVSPKIVNNKSIQLAHKAVFIQDLLDFFVAKWMAKKETK